VNPLDFEPFWRPFRENTRRFQEVFPHHADFARLAQETETLAYLIRSYSVYSMTCAALGHPGGSFSEAELLAVMFNYVLRFDAGEPQWPQRDVFYLSKCHACPGLYAALALFGYFPIGDLTRYGGDTAYLRTFEHSFGLSEAGHCFPSGHASGGFALLALYFAAYLYARRPALFLLPGLLVGTVFALGQQARGAHFLSHDLWSLSFCWFGALGLFLLFRPDRWPGPIARCGAPMRLAWSTA